MKKYLFTAIVICLMAACKNAPQAERISDFNFDWKFSLSADKSAISKQFDDSKWKSINLPHDWSIDFPFDTLKGEGCTGYLPGGVAWYRKSFNLPVSENEKISILFDGVYNNSEVWINQQKLGEHPYGYTPFYFDLTPYLKKDGGKNVIVVKVDRSRFADSRWYSGSGIYRNVKLIRSNKLHIPIWGTFVSTPKVDTKSALVHVETKVRNDYEEDVTCQLKSEIYSPQGKLVAIEEKELSLSAKSSLNNGLDIQLKEADLWNTNHPALYTLHSKIYRNGEEIEDYTTKFGIRSLKFDPDKGFFLNGKNMKIKGVCLHHDAGLVGAAVPKGVWRRRLKLLKEAGCNAIRISHNPASEELLELCDEMGLMVQDEFFDEWDYPKDKRLNMNQRISTDYITRSYSEHFQQWAERDLKTCILAHRNHPSIIQWSIGNEIEWTYPRNKKATGFWDADWSGNYFWNPTPLKPKEIKKRYERMKALEHNIGETAQKLSSWTKQLDTTRPVIANCILPSASYVSGYADALDIIGFSYRRVMYDYGHHYFPKKPIMGTENVAQWHEWKAIMERPFVAGTYLWTGFDYMGEAHQRNKKDRRKRGTNSGLLDFAGFKKPSYYMLKSLWNEEEACLNISTQAVDQSIYRLDSKQQLIEKKKNGWQKALWIWHPVNHHWNYQAKEMVAVEVISNCPEVELFLNGKSLGKKKLIDFEDRIYKWAVPFVAGKLEAKAKFNKQEVTRELTTATSPIKAVISCDKKALKADAYDVAHIQVQLVDQAGNPVRNADREIKFEVNGPIVALGVDNGDAHSLQTYHSKQIITHEGRALLLLQSTKEKGSASISVRLDGVQSSIEIPVN